MTTENWADLLREHHISLTWLGECCHEPIWRAQCGPAIAIDEDPGVAVVEAYERMQQKAIENGRS